MRALLIPLAVIIPFLVFSGLRSITGDPVIAVVFGLIFFVTVASWFGGRPVSTGQLKTW